MAKVSVGLINRFLPDEPKWYHWLLIWFLGVPYTLGVTIASLQLAEWLYSEVGDQLFVLWAVPLAVIALMHFFWFFILAFSLPIETIIKKIIKVARKKQTSD